MAPFDMAVLTVLQKLDSISEKDNQRRTAVSFMDCFDGWFTDNANCEILSSIFGHVNHCITLVVPVQFAERLLPMFRRRSVVLDEQDSTAWAHFNVHFVGRSQEQLDRDPQDYLQWRRGDQSAIISLLSQIWDSIEG